VCYGAEKHRWPMAGRHTAVTLSSLRVCCERALIAPANGIHTESRGGASGNRLHGGLWELAHLGGIQRRFGGGGFPP
jgi:hypothetical protein